MRKRKSRTEAADDYIVGYGRPPKQTRFQPGTSGNPRGRPKGTKNAATMANAALDQKIPVTEKGMRRHMTVREVAFRRLAEKAIAGDLKTLAFLLTLASEPQPNHDGADTQALSREDAGIIASYLERLQTHPKHES